tara:strand:- start:3263 stop:3631 length:369 start_codon:yes stop_codon:yes gene_type:complete
MKMIKICSLLVVLVLASANLQAQEKPKYEREGDKIRVTYYHENGVIKETGTYYKSVLDGKWTQYDDDGNILFEAYYDNGDKVGKWFKWDLEEKILYEMVYEDNTLLSVDKWKLEKRNLLAER